MGAYCLASPGLALHGLALPFCALPGFFCTCLALPCLALPCLLFSCIAFPGCTLFCLALPGLARCCLAWPCLAFLALRCIALPCDALSCSALACLAWPGLSLPVLACPWDALPGLSCQDIMHILFKNPCFYLKITHLYHQNPPWNQKARIFSGKIPHVDKTYTCSLPKSPVEPPNHAFSRRKSCIYPKCVKCLVVGLNWGFP